MKNYIIVLILPLVALISCKKEEATVQADFPFVYTNPATNVNDTGVLFSAKILNEIDEKIIEYGFKWESDNAIYTAKAEEITPEKEFSLQVNCDLIKEKEYYYRAYVKTVDKTIIGNQELFISKGSKKPIISSIYPQEIINNCELIIYGENFTHNIDRVKVEVKAYYTYECQITSVSPNKIKAIIPKMLNGGSTDFNLQIGETTIFLEDELWSTVPYIYSFSSIEVYSGDIITINGANFTKNPGENTFVFISEETNKRVEANILEITNSEIKILVPAIEDSPFNPTSHHVRYYNDTKTAFPSEHIKIRNSWENKQAPPIIVNAESFEYNDEGYIVNFDENRIKHFDPSSSDWITITEIPEDTVLFQNITLFEEENLWIFTRYESWDFNTTTSSWKYNIASNVWTKIASIPFYYTNTTAVYYNGFIYFITANAGVWKYDPRNDQYQELNNFNQSSSFVHAFVLQDKLYASTLQQTFVYNPEFDSWSYICTNNFKLNLNPLYTIAFHLNDYEYILSENLLYKYDHLSNKWIQTNIYPGDSRVQRIALILNEDAYIFALSGYFPGAYPKLYKYNTSAYE